MEYIELVCIPTQGVQASEILTALLADVGFESFSENGDGTLSAFIQSKDYSSQLAAKLASDQFSGYLASFSVKTIADQNWNALWESQYEPVIIDGKCSVRAPFHAKPAGAEYDIVIMPKMSFGTAHHETTKLMIQYLLEMDVSGKTLLDMGSGTAVLAILSGMKGAKEVTAIDNDEWAFNNALENIQLNNVPEIKVLLGDSALLPGLKFDVILANINRNILLNDIPGYRGSLNNGGKLVMSGFYREDLPLIELKSGEWGLKLVSVRSDNNWTAACFSSPIL